MKKLVYEKYKNQENIITIDLHNGYTIISIIEQVDINTYIVQLMLKENTVDKWDLIERAESIVFKTKKNIQSMVLKQVANMFYEGFFGYYIERFEFEQKMFSIGLEMDDAIRLGGAETT